MDCCKANASPRRKALLSEFQQFLDQVEESERYSGQDEGRGMSQVYESQNRGGVPQEAMGKLPRYPDYMDPSKRPLIASVQVLEYRPTGNKKLLDLKIPDITGVEYCEIPDKKRDQCATDDPHSQAPYGKVNERHEPQMDSSACPQQTARMRPDPATSRYVEISTAHMCPPGYGEGVGTSGRPASASAPGEPSKACPDNCTDILADQERRSRERRQLEAHPGDLKIGEPKICPPGYPTGRQPRAQPGGMQAKPYPPGKGQPGGMPAKMCQPKQPGMAMGGAHPAMAMRAGHPGMATSGMADPKMCPPKFSVGLSPDSSTGQDPKCAVDYQKCAPKRNPGVCGPSEGGHPLGSREKTKSRELIGGVLLTGCDCVKRNGLQHDCKRTLCQGRPECLTNPPMCLPSGGPGCIPTSYFES